MTGVTCSGLTELPCLQILVHLKEPEGTSAQMGGRDSTQNAPSSGHSPANQFQGLCAVGPKGLVYPIKEMFRRLRYLVGRLRNSYA